MVSADDYFPLLPRGDLIREDLGVEFFLLYEIVVYLKRWLWMVGCSCGVVVVGVAGGRGAGGESIGCSMPMSLWRF